MCSEGLNGPYISVWIALDDITAQNGALSLESLGASLRSTPHLSAGSLILFRSNVWHYSAPNASQNTRRILYVQYSSKPIRALAKDVTPLSFAIACL